MCCPALGHTVCPADHQCFYSSLSHTERSLHTHSLEGGSHQPGPQVSTLASCLSENRFKILLLVYKALNDLGPNTLLTCYKITNRPDPSDHLAQVYCVSSELELNTVKQRLASMHQISGTKSLKTAALLEPSMLLNQDWRLLCLLLVLMKILFLYCTVTLILEFYASFILFELFAFPFLLVFNDFFYCV